jgi:hypothetical protein
MMGKIISIDDFRRQRLERQLKKRLEEAEGDLAKAYDAQRELIHLLRRAKCPTRYEERILEIMEGVSYAMVGQRAYLMGNAGHGPEKTIRGLQSAGQELPRFPLED